MSNDISCCAVESYYIAISRDGKDFRTYVVKSLEKTPSCTQEQDGIDMTSFGPFAFRF